MFNHKQINQWFEKNAAALVEKHPLLTELAEQMAERLSYIKSQPQNVLCVDVLSIESRNILRSHYPNAEITMCGAYSKLNALLAQSNNTKNLRDLFRRSKKNVIEFAEPKAIPIQSASQGMVWSNLGLVWQSDIMSVLKEWQRVLHVDGWVMFSSLGPDTCKEVRLALGDVHHQYIPAFVDMHDLGDLLVQAGFSEPVMAMENITLAYSTFDALLGDLACFGQNFLLQQPSGLRRKLFIKALEDRLAHHKNDLGQYQLTLEVVHGHAWKAQPKINSDGHAVIRWDIPRKPHSI